MGAVSWKVETARRVPNPATRVIASRKAASGGPHAEERLEPRAMAASRIYRAPRGKLRMCGKCGWQSFSAHLCRLGALVVTVDEIPGGPVAQQALHQRGVHGVARALGDDVALDAPAGERKVADQIEYLVAHELVGKAQRPVLHALRGEDNRARVRDAADQAHVAQLGLILLEAKGPRRRNQAGVVSGFQVGRELFAADGRREVDGVVDAVALAGVDADEFAALAYLDLLQDADVLAAAALLL